MNFKILVLNGTFASSVAVTLDMLSAAAQLASRTGGAPPVWQVVGSQRTVTLSNGLRIEAAPMKPPTANEIWVMPGLGLPDPVRVLDRLTQADALRAQAQLLRAAGVGALIAASCSATLLLAKAGLLANKRATTTWWLATTLKQLAPSCAIDVDRMVVRDVSVMTAGAALAQTDLMLALIGEQCGLKIADRLARVMLLDHREAQSPFIVPAAYSSGSDLIAQLTQRIELALPDSPTIPNLAAELGMSARTLARHVEAATGRSPMALVQSVRLFKAQGLLANSRLSVDEIAARVGYSDGTALRRLIKSATRVTPRQLRTRAQAPHKRLAQPQ